MSLRIALSTTVAALALVAAGCGGDDDSDTDPTAAWAAGFCTAVTEWTDELQSIASQFSDASNLSQDGLETAAEDVRTATEGLVDDIEGLGRPETDSGDEVESALDSLSATLETESGEITETVEGVSGIADIPSAITSTSASLSAMGTAFSTALETIDSADAGDELQTALEDSPECADISS